MGQEPDDQVLVLADPLDALGGGIGHVGQGGTREVGQLEVLEVGPQVLDRVQLGRGGGEPLVLLRELGDFLYPPQGRPCGRPPPAAVLGRQHHSRVAPGLRSCLKVCFPTAWPTALPGCPDWAALKSFARARLARYGRGMVFAAGSHEVRVWPPLQFPG